jgi:hypothetical protein
VSGRRSNLQFTLVGPARENERWPEVEAVLARYGARHLTFVEAGKKACHFVSVPVLHYVELSVALRGIEGVSGVRGAV